MLHALHALLHTRWIPAWDLEWNSESNTEKHKWWIKSMSNEISLILFFSFTSRHLWWPIDDQYSRVKKVHGSWRCSYWSIWRTSTVLGSNAAYEGKLMSSRSFKFYSDNNQTWMSWILFKLFWINIVMCWTRNDYYRHFSDDLQLWKVKILRYISILSTLERPKLKITEI